MLRILAHLWAFPITFAGFLFATVGGCRLLGVREGALEFVAAWWGPWAAWARRWAGVNFGDVIVYRSELAASDPVLRAHERVHQRQVWRLGIFHAVLYLAIGPLLCLAYGAHPYRDHPAELAARRGAGQE